MWSLTFCHCQELHWLNFHWSSVEGPRFDWAINCLLGEHQLRDVPVVFEVDFWSCSSWSPFLTWEGCFWRSDLKVPTQTIQSGPWSWHGPPLADSASWVFAHAGQSHLRGQFNFLTVYWVPVTNQMVGSWWHDFGLLSQRLPNFDCWFYYLQHRSGATGMEPSWSSTGYPESHSSHPFHLGLSLAKTQDERRSSPGQASCCLASVQFHLHRYWSCWWSGLTLNFDRNLSNSYWLYGNLHWWSPHQPWSSSSHPCTHWSLTSVTTTETLL